jgi:hypothetical protein
MRPQEKLWEQLRPAAQSAARPTGYATTAGNGQSATLLRSSQRFIAGTLRRAYTAKPRLRAVPSRFVSRLSPFALDKPEKRLLSALDRLARLDAEMDRLRTRRPVGWANSLTAYDSEAQQLRRDLGLEYERDVGGRVFLVHRGSALYYVASGEDLRQT